MLLSFITNRKSHRHYTQLHCFSIFLVFISPFTILLFGAEAFPRWIFHCLLFITGWFFWTFMEYIVHRFWMHGKGHSLYKFSSKRHLHHHTHPHDLKITSVHRFIMFLLIIVLVCLSHFLNNYFTLFTGFYSGFAGFCFIHVLLHKKWGRKIFRELVQYHIYHHCKYPDRCHGVTVTWWDKLFNTAPPENAVITNRIMDFYFNEHHHS